MSKLPLRCLWQRVGRAWSNTRPIDPLFSVLPAIVTTAVTTYVAWVEVRGEAGARMSTYTVPAIWGLAALSVTLFVLHGAEFVYRSVTGKARKGSPRSLYGLSVRSIEQTLRGASPPNPTILAITSSLAEVQNFAEDILQLLERCGWHVSGGMMPVPKGGVTTGVAIYLPHEGNEALKLFGEWLNHLGYNATICQGGATGTGHIYIGEAVR